MTGDPAHQRDKGSIEVQDLRDSLSFVPYNTKIVDGGDHRRGTCRHPPPAPPGKLLVAATNRDGELFYTTDAARTFADRIVDIGLDEHLRRASPNPCDVVCTEIWHPTGYDPKKIIGSGCGLDSARLRSKISRSRSASRPSQSMRTWSG